jgi:hypothetical protein
MKVSIMQAQQMAVDTVGLALAVALTALTARRSEAARRALPLAALPFLIAGDLFSISKELGSIHLRTLNKERTEILAEAWLEGKGALAPVEVSKRERLALPPALALGAMPLVIGPLEKTARGEDDVMRLLAMQKVRQSRWRGLLFGWFSGSGGGDEISRGNGNGSSGGRGIDRRRRRQQERYFLSAEGPAARAPSPHIDTNHPAESRGSRGSWRAALHQAIAATVGPPRGAVRVALRCDAGAEDLALAVLHTAILRRKHRAAALDNMPTHREGGGIEGEAVVVPEADITAAGMAAERSLRHFLRELAVAGWQTTPFLLSSAEKARPFSLSSS